MLQFNLLYFIFVCNLTFYILSLEDEFHWSALFLTNISFSKTTEDSCAHPPPTPHPSRMIGVFKVRVSTHLGK